MISVIEVYNTVRDLCNKDQKGFITPRVFNTFAEIAQQNVFNEMFKELGGAKSLRARNLDAAGKDSVYRGVKEDISAFVTEVALETDQTGVNYTDANLFNKPADVFRIVSLHVVDGTDYYPIEILHDSDKMPLILSSNLSAPTTEYPVALVSRNLEVFPSDVNSVVLTYYRQPASKYASNVGGFSYGDVDATSGPRLVASTQMDDGFIVPDINSSRHFELAEHYKSEVIFEIARMIGIRLRDEFIAVNSTQETNSK